MNLIEKLGGYEEAKKLHDNVSCGSTATYVDGCFYSKESLGLFLLEYRRENNIFEVGDLVVLPYTNYRSDVFELTEEHREVYDEKGICYRHATDEEIKAGHRL